MFLQITNKFKSSPAFIWLPCGLLTQKIGTELSRMCEYRRETMTNEFSQFCGKSKENRPEASNPLQSKCCNNNDDDGS